MHPYRGSNTPLSDDGLDPATLAALRPWRPPFVLVAALCALPTTLLFVLTWAGMSDLDPLHVFLAVLPFTAALGCVEAHFFLKRLRGGA